MLPRAGAFASHCATIDSCLMAVNGPWAVTLSASPVSR